MIDESDKQVCFWRGKAEDFAFDPVAWENARKEIRDERVGESARARHQRDLESMAT